MPSVLFVCAVEVEWRALNEALASSREVSAGDGAVYTQGTLQLDGRIWTATIAQVGVGNIAAALGTVRAVAFSSPQVVVFVGVCGGLKDVGLGDVIAVTAVYAYESGKEVDDGFRPRPRRRDVPDRTVSIGRSMARRASENPGPYRIVAGPVAAGEKVVASSGGPSAEVLRDAYGDALGVEMESAGFFEAMSQLGDLQFAVFRGVSDLLDGKSQADSSGWQDRAARNAVVSAKIFLGLHREAVPADGSARFDDADSGPAAEPQELPIPVPSPTHAFVLIAPTGSKLAQSVAVSKFPLSVIVDLDPHSDQAGLGAAALETVREERHVNLVVPGDQFSPGTSSTTWLFACGLAGRTIGPASDYREWLASYRRPSMEVVEAALRRIGQRNICVLIARDSLDQQLHVDNLLADIVAATGGQCAIYELAGGAPTSPLAEDVIDLDPAEVKLAFERHAAAAAVSRPATYSLPGADAAVTVEAEDSAWLAEDLAPVWLGLGGEGEAAEATLAFLNGGELSWSALRADADVRRTLLSDLREDAQAALDDRRAVRINLFHEPGAGGSSVARRLAFDLHTAFPVVEVRTTKSVETSQRIAWIARATGCPVLVVADSAELSDRFVDDLLDELRSSSVPAVVLHVSRRFDRPSGLSRSHFLESKLTDLEASAFQEAYGRQVPGSAPRLAEVASFRDDRRNAFFFALAAFESDFDGIERYVAQRMVNASDKQREVLRMCSIAHYYGQQVLTEACLARIVGLPVGRSESFSHLLGPGVRSLLWRTTESAWRTVHQLVAQEILKQLAATRERWTQHLSDWSRDFIDLLVPPGPVASDDDLETLRTVFVYRGGEAILGSAAAGDKVFSRLVQDMPSENGAVGVLSYLAERFPNEPHFSAHVARYYAFRIRDYERAASYADSATAADPKSSVLQHVLGMVHRARAYDLIGRRESMKSVISAAGPASQCFARARELSGGSNEYAFISDAQLKIRVIDYAVGQAGGSIPTYLRSGPDPYVVECISEAEELLNSVREGRDQRAPSGYEESSSARLSGLYGDYSDALQMFDSLLARPDVAPIPVRRQVVWTHLARAGRDWSNLPAKSIKRIVELLEMNLSEGGYSAIDIRQWTRAIRYLETPPSHDRVLELLAFWREQSRSPDALYYSYVAHAVDVLDGIATSTLPTRKYLEECSRTSRGNPRRTWSYEWLGPGHGFGRLVHQSELGEWSAGAQFWSDPSRLERVRGRVRSVSGPQAGVVEIEGLEAFFVPSRAGVERGRHENSIVDGFLGFSLDSLRFWDVRLVS